MIKKHHRLTILSCKLSIVFICVKVFGLCVYVVYKIKKNRERRDRLLRNIQKEKMRLKKKEQR